MRKKVILFLLCMFIAGIGGDGFHRFLNGLDPARNIREYNLDIYTTENGLPQSSVLYLIQTSDGYLWMATYEGLARFDGIRFRIFDTSNTPEMESNRVKALLEDSQRNLWIATSGGLLRYSQGSFKNYTTNDGLSDNFVLSLCEDRHSGLWIGTTAGLNRLENGRITIYTQQQGLSMDYISALAADHQGNLWIGTSGGGLHRLDLAKNLISRCGVEGCPPNMDIRTLFIDKQNRLWIGTADKGMALLNDGNFKFYSQSDGLSGNDVRAIFQDSNGTLWVGTNGQGLNTFKNGVFACADSEPGFFSSPIRSIFEDRESNLWVGTRDGVSQLKDGKFIIYNKRNGLPVDSVRTVFQDQSGCTWIGTINGGLVRFKDSRFDIFGTRQGLASEHIWTIAQSRDGSIWFGTYGGGLHRLKDDNIIKIYNTRAGLANNIVRAVYVDREDNVWVGTNGGGVDIIKKQGDYKEIVNTSTKNGLSDNFIYAISGDSRGSIWIGTYSGDINRFDTGDTGDTGDKGKITVYSQKDGLTGHAIWSIYPDAEGVVWIGTDDGGLLRFKNNTFTRFTTKDGLYSDLAFQVLEDQTGYLWMNCNKGIFSIRKSDLEDYAAGKIPVIPYISFGKARGIKNTECAGPAQPAGICTREGKLWFPTIRGAIVMDRKNIDINTVIPPVVIEEIRADGKSIYSYPLPREQEILLPPGIKRLDFIFTGLSLTDSRQMLFRYKLDGFDEDWMDAGNQRQVSYTNIKPGHYTFQVTACNNDGVWNEQGTRMPFTLKPFLWQTWGFRIFFLVGFAILSYLLINFVKTHLRLIAFWKKKKYIGSYEIDEQIGIGGMGVVYKVHSLMDKSKTFAMKVLKEEYLLDEVQKKRFKNESLLVDRLDHPHIVKVYERGQHGEMLYIVMELLEGHTLAERFKTRQYPDIQQCVHIVAQLTHILVNLHREEIIHRDLKPENIMLIDRKGDPDFVKLLDFGIARVQSFSHLTETGQVLGTISYMPPEVVSDAAISPAVDIYSLGIIAYEMLTQQKPFTGDKPLSTMRKILNDIPPAPMEINPDVPERLNKLVLRMIEKNPQDRPDAREVLAILVTLR